jgi:hypothetical protein
MNNKQPYELSIVGIIVLRALPAGVKIKIWLVSHACHATIQGTSYDLGGLL